MTNRITRKTFLATATRSLAAASVGAIGVSVADASQIRAATQPAPWPWPYRQLDPEDIRKRAHKAYYDGGCCYGAFNALVVALGEIVGEPFTLVPTQMMYYGGGGAAGWGTLCGALNGAAAGINLVVDRSNANALISELIGWYTTTAFPSTISNDYAQAHVFLVNRNDKILKQNVSGSPLCHTSVSLWCSESGFKASSAERAERCARLTGDVAARSVQLLNDFTAGQFRATFVAPRSVPGCLGCHDSAMGNVVASVKMDCQQCHKENFDHLY
jgi:putative redox-active protein with C_GCAxxG_C_C motif